MITNNSYIRSDYGIINKNIIAQTKLEEYNKECNKNFLTTKEYVDSRNSNVNINYHILDPYVYEIKNDGLGNEYIEKYNTSSTEDIDGKEIILNNSYNFYNNEYYIGRYITRNNENITYGNYRIVKISINGNNGTIIEKNNIQIGQQLYCLTNKLLYQFVKYKDLSNNEKIIFTPININLNINSNINNNLTEGDIQDEIKDELIFNIDNNILYHNINDSNLNIINNSDIINLYYIKINNIIKTYNNNTSFYFDNNKPIYNFFNSYLFSKIKQIIYSDYQIKNISDEKIISYYSYSGIPKIIINNSTITIPNENSTSSFTLDTNYLNLKQEDFYVILEKENEDTNYIYYKGIIELNYNNNIENNNINIKYNKLNETFEDNGSNFESEADVGNLQFILINYYQQCALNILYDATNDIYTISKINNNNIKDETFYKDLTLLISFSIDLEIEIDENNNIKNVNFNYKFNLLSSPNEQKIKYWFRNNNTSIIIPTYYYKEINNS